MSRRPPRATAIRTTTPSQPRAGRAVQNTNVNVASVTTQNPSIASRVGGTLKRNWGRVAIAATIGGIAADAQWNDGKALKFTQTKVVEPVVQTAGKAAGTGAGAATKGVIEGLLAAFEGGGVYVLAGVAVVIMIMVLK